jgi:hypothetical protein
MIILFNYWQQPGFNPWDGFFLYSENHDGKSKWNSLGFVKGFAIRPGM